MTRMPSTASICLASFFALGWAAPCHATELSGVYRGTLGDAAVVMELDLTDPAHVSGRFFYQRQHLDLALEGTLDGDQLELDQGLSGYDNAPRPRLTLHAHAMGWQGQWQSPQGEQRAVQLSVADLPAEAIDTEPFWHELRGASPYEYLRLSELRLVEGRVQAFMGHSLRWQVEPESMLTLFQVVEGYPEAQRAVLNRELRARLWGEVSAYHACLLGASRMGNGEFEQTVTPQLLTPNILSVSIFTRYDCGGAHPDFGDAPLNLDARTGQHLSLEDVLWVGRGQPLHYDDRDGTTPSDRSDVDFDTFSRYRGETLAPWLVAQFKRLYPEQMVKTTDDDCDYADPEVWRFPAWHFTTEGVYLGPGFARAMRACEGTEWSVLPWRVLREHPGGVPLALPSDS